MPARARILIAALLLAALFVVGVGAAPHDSVATHKPRAKPCNRHCTSSTTPSSVPTTTTTTSNSVPSTTSTLESTTTTTTARPWPPSYTNGPLGAATPLPTPGHKFLVLWHLIQGHTWAQTQAEIAQREADAGRSFSGLGLGYGGGGTFQGFTGCAYITPAEQREAWVHSRGSLPVVTWSPNATLADINAGARDGCIKAVADYFRQFPFTVMLRPLHEFNGGGANRGCGQPLVGAFRRIVTLFQGEGATNVGFMWSPIEAIQNCSDGSTTDASYPGDAYVDWITPDRYNHNCPAGGCWSTPCHGGWAEWWELFNYTGTCSPQASIYSTWSSHKAFLPAETGSKPDPANTTRKGNWFRNIAIDPRAAPGMDRLIGIEFFDQDVSITEGQIWLVDDPKSQLDTYAGFLALARAPLFSG